MRWNRHRCGPAADRLREGEVGARSGAASLEPRWAEAVGDAMMADDSSRAWQGGTAAPARHVVDPGAWRRRLRELPARAASDRTG